jgi:DNA mismatch repair protein MutS
MVDNKPVNLTARAAPAIASEPSMQTERFVSVLFDGDPGAAAEQLAQPDFFVDLNLDQIVGTLTAGRAEYELEPLLHVTLGAPDAVLYRHEVMQDLGQDAVTAAVKAFADDMHEVRVKLAGAAKRYYAKQQQRWFLDAATLYDDTVRRLAEVLAGAELKSRGLRRVADYLASYIRDKSVTGRREQEEDLLKQLGQVHYSMHLDGGSIRVRRFDERPDYSAEVLAHFERFRQGKVEIEQKKRPVDPDMNHIEAAILDMVGQLYPELFAALAQFPTQRAHFIDPVIARFDREVQFYMGFIELRQRLEHTGLAFCYPELNRDDKAVRSVQGFDLALAGKLAKDGQKVVCNDFYLEGAERIFVVSGPNQGGKTTFARAFGQLHYLGCLGLPVPGKEAKLLLFDRLFTHFEREENIENRRGKLQDDLVRIHAILDAATPDSIIVMNEIFTSTALEDALFLSEKILRRIMDLDALAVCVTFIDELTTLGPQTVSTLSTVVPDNPAERTFKIERRKADGKAYALAIAQKYRLTHDALRERFAS